MRPEPREHLTPEEVHALIAGATWTVSLEDADGTPNPFPEDLPSGSSDDARSGDADREPVLVDWDGTSDCVRVRAGAHCLLLPPAHALQLARALRRCVYDHLYSPAGEE